MPGYDSARKGNKVVTVAKSSISTKYMIRHTETLFQRLYGPYIKPTSVAMYVTSYITAGNYNNVIISHWDSLWSKGLHQHKWLTQSRRKYESIFTCKHKLGPYRLGNRCKKKWLGK